MIPSFVSAVLLHNSPIHGYGAVTANRHWCQSAPRFNLSSQIKEPHEEGIMQ
jgi:hypothetical protein